MSPTKVVLALFAILLSACAGGDVRVDREITLLSEVEYDAWHTRRQFPYELRYSAVTATYATEKPDEFVRFHCGPIGHVLRHIRRDGTEVDELAVIRLQTQKGKQLCHTATARLHELATKDVKGEQLAILQLEDRHKSGKPHVAAVDYKARVLFVEAPYR